MSINWPARMLEAEQAMSVRIPLALTNGNMRFIVLSFFCDFVVLERKLKRLTNALTKQSYNHQG